MSRHVVRDPFSRFSIVSERNYNPPADGCGWCGRFRLTPSGRRYLLRFVLVADGAARGHTMTTACTRSCAEALLDRKFAA